MYRAMHKKYGEVKMKYISHLIPDEEMKGFIEKYNVGVESIDFSISDNLDQLSKSIKRYSEKMKYMGTDQLILHGPFLDVNPCAYDSLVREATMTRFSQCYEAGLELGAKKIVFHSGMNPYVYYKESWAAHVALFWQEFMEDRREIEVVLENVFDNDWELLLDVYRQVDQPNFKLCLDIGHAHCYSSVEVLEWGKNLAPYVTHVHVHDNNGDRDAHVGLGKGNLPWQEVLAYLPENEARTWTIECMREDDVKACLSKL